VSARPCILVDALRDAFGRAERLAQHVGVVRDAVKPGGLVVFETFVGEPGGESSPRRRAYRLRPGELRSAFEGFEILRAREVEGIEPELAWIVARRPR